MNTKALISSVLVLTIGTSNVYALPSASGAAGGMGHGSSAGYGGSNSGSSNAGSSSNAGDAGSSSGQSGNSTGLSYQPYTNDWSPVDNYIAECKANGVTIGRYAALHVDIECAGD